MKLATVNPRLDFNVDDLFVKEVSNLVTDDINIRNPQFVTCFEN